MTNDKDSAVLLPCPFCGGEAMVRHYRYKGAGASGMETPEPFIRCGECGAEQPRIPCDESPWGQKNNKKTYAQAEAEAIEAWNKRQPTQSDALLEGDAQTILYLLGVRHGREDERAKIAAEASQPTQSEDNCVECNGKGYAEIIDGCERPCDVCYGECFLRQPTQSDDEAYDLGKRDGYEKAVQDIDMLTGGDGEYCYSTIEGERHCPNVDTMKARIARRLRQFTQSDALREALGSVIALLDTQAEPPKSVVSVQDYARWANARIGLGLVMIAPRLRAALQEQSK